MLAEGKELLAYWCAFHIDLNLLQPLPSLRDWLRELRPDGRARSRARKGHRADPNLMLLASPHSWGFLP